MSALPDFLGGGIFGFAGCSSGAMDDVAAAMAILTSCIEGDVALDILSSILRLGGVFNEWCMGAQRQW